MKPDPTEPRSPTPSPEPTPTRRHAGSENGGSRAGNGLSRAESGVHETKADAATAQRGVHETKATQTDVATAEHGSEAARHEGVRQTQVEPGASVKQARSPAQAAQPDTQAAQPTRPEGAPDASAPGAGLPEAEAAPDADARDGGLPDAKTTSRSAPADSAKKPLARPRLRAASSPEVTHGVPLPGEWASLLGDLSPGDRDPEWRVHDRTHLELAVDLPLADDGQVEHVWDAYFFVPRSLRLDSSTYPKEELYRDFQSYVRFAVGRRPLAELAEDGVPRLAAALQADEATAVRELRVFASEVRTALLAARRRLEGLRRDREYEAMDALARTLLTRIAELLDAVRGSFRYAQTRGAQIATRWTDEDLSLMVETMLASLSLDLRRAKQRDLAALVAAGAVKEARYRRDHGLDGIGTGKVTKREIEHLEFRRHVLKRFTGSVLEVKRQVEEAGRLTLQILYAIAASVAMSFAVVAAAYHGTQHDNSAFHSPWTWAVVVVLAYAGKDRIKASLQGVFSRWVARHLPDRRWTLRDGERPTPVAWFQERSAFVAKGSIPAEVRETRNSTREHALEEHARPEEVLWHQKRCRLDSPAVRTADARYSAVSEIFRLDLRRWLVHTDDPKQRIVFADPDDAHVYAARAPRVYNIAVVYRLRRAGETEVPWRRLRVVVSRKGIVRIEQVC